MLKTHLGPVEEPDSVGYLRPETAQGMFVDFTTVAGRGAARSSRSASRRSASRSATRSRRTTSSSARASSSRWRLEFFVKPGTDDEWFEYWVQHRLQWFLDLGMTKDKLRLRPITSPTSSRITRRPPPTWSTSSRSVGASWRGSRTEPTSTFARTRRPAAEDLTYFDQEKEERYLPYVVEPAVGVDRSLLAFLVDAYRVEEVPTAKGGTDKRTVLGLHRSLAPIKVAVLPLSRNERLVPEAKRVFDLVKGEWMCQYDDAGAIGRRYRRQDEVGTPFCVTVDFDSLEDRQVTVRERDTMAQDRLPIEGLLAYLRERL